MKVKHFMLLPLVMTLFGCTGNNYSLSVKNWVGTREAFFLKGWGEPDKSYISGKSKFLVYDEDGGSPKGCTTTFEIIDEEVESFDYDGKGCVGDFYTLRYDKRKYQ